MAKRREIEPAGDEGVPNRGSAQLNVELPFFASPSISPSPPKPSAPTKCPRLPDVWPRRRLPRLRTFRHQSVRPLSYARATSVTLCSLLRWCSRPRSGRSLGLRQPVPFQSRRSSTSLPKKTRRLSSPSANSQIAKIGERINRESAGVTNSITPPQTVAPASQASAPSRLPAAGESRSSRLPIVTNWSIRETRGGYVYVQGNGDVYQVVPGAPLPGLGPVEKIERHDGRWLVVTPKGIIISMRDRRYFEQF